MSRSSSARYLPAFVALVILLAWAFQPAMGIFQQIKQANAITSPVKSLAIAPPQNSIKTCHHHLEGCPIDCFCPKINGEPQESHMDQRDLPRIYEPSLVQCTEKSALTILEVSSTYLHKEPHKILLLNDQIGFLALLCESLPLSPPRDPTPKIPIA